MSGSDPALAIPSRLQGWDASRLFDLHLETSEALPRNDEDRKLFACSRSEFAHWTDSMARDRLSYDAEIASAEMDIGPLIMSCRT